MRSVSIDAVVLGRSRDEVLDALRQFERYPEVSPAVRSVRVEPAPTGGQYEVRSHWEVDFGDGVLQWSEHDTVSLQEGTLRFEQVSGDFETFLGAWHVAEADSGCRVQFQAQFDMGIPSLNALLEPMAEQALRANVADILTGLFDEVRVEPDSR